jgi:hypothetical protein
MSLHHLTQQIRDFINEPRHQDALLKEIARWFQLTAALDVAEDTDLAIDAYLSSDRRSAGDLYLEIFGVLQAVFVQQDAIAHLAEALDITLDLDGYPRLKEIRDARNDIVGHPTSRKNGTSFHSLVRMHMGREEAQVSSAYSNGRSEFRKLDLSGLIGDQRSLAVSLL